MRGEGGDSYTAVAGGAVKDFLGKDLISMTRL
jgi:hypothetical protein